MLQKDIETYSQRLAFSDVPTDASVLDKNKEDIFGTALTNGGVIRNLVLFLILMSAFMCFTIRYIGCDLNWLLFSY